MKIGFIVLVLTLGFSAQANQTQKISKAQTDKLATEYYINESKILLGFKTKSVDPHNCNDQQQGGRSCQDVACDLVGSYNCDSISEVERVGRACRGNRSGRCLQSMCAKVGSYNCDSISEIEQLAPACRGSENEDCVDMACNLVGSYNCDSISEVLRVGQACHSVRAACLESVCQRVGSYNCDSISEIEQIADSCRGN